MSLLLKTWTPSDVQAADDPAKAFCSYVQQRIGVPFPTGKDIAIVRKKAKEFFDAYPHTDWYTLCRVADWCKVRKRRPPRPWMVIDNFRNAWAGGYIPELNKKPVQVDVETAIAAALSAEQREGWRRRLLMAQGPETRKKVLVAWQNDQLTSSSSL